MPLRTCVIFNPAAGRGRALPVAGRLRERVALLQNAAWFQTSKRGDAVQFARDAVKSGFETVFAAGGDGTIHEVINGLMQAGQNEATPVLGILPLGSANDFARGLGLPPGERALSERITSGTNRRVDIGQLTDARGQTRYFGFSMGVGFLAAVASASDRITRLRGTWIYLWGCVCVLRHYARGPLLCATFDDQSPVRIPVWYMSINNTPTVGGVPLSPGASMQDGLLDVVYVDQTSRARLVALFPTVELGTHLQQPEFHARQVRHLTLWSEEPFPIHLDGQIVPVDSSAGSLSIRVLPAALTVLV